jgi:hypothetical protein
MRSVQYNYGKIANGMLINHVACFRKKVSTFIMALIQVHFTECFILFSLKTPEVLVSWYPYKNSTKNEPALVLVPIQMGKTAEKSNKLSANDFN